MATIPELSFLRSPVAPVPRSAPRPMAKQAVPHGPPKPTPPFRPGMEPAPIGPLSAAIGLQKASGAQAMETKPFTLEAAGSALLAQQGTMNRTERGASAVKGSPAVPAQPPVEYVPLEVVPGAVEVYRVQQGDTLWGIARRQLGADATNQQVADRVKVLAGQLPAGSNPDKLAVGTVLMGPDSIPVAKGSNESPAAAGAAVDPGQPPVEYLPLEVVPDSVAVYRVQPGDSLWSIARGQLGADATNQQVADRVKVLAGQLPAGSDPDKLAVGAVLIDPDDAARVVQTQARREAASEETARELAPQNALFDKRRIEAEELRDIDDRSRDPRPTNPDELFETYVDPLDMFSPFTQGFLNIIDDPNDPDWYDVFGQFLAPTDPLPVTDSWASHIGDVNGVEVTDLALKAKLGGEWVSDLSGNFRARLAWTKVPGEGIEYRLIIEETFGAKTASLAKRNPWLLIANPEAGAGGYSRNTMIGYTPEGSPLLTPAEAMAMLVNRMDQSRQGDINPSVVSEPGALGSYALPQGDESPWSHHISFSSSFAGLDYRLGGGPDTKDIVDFLLSKKEKPKDGKPSLGERINDFLSFEASIEHRRRHDTMHQTQVETNDFDPNLVRVTMTRGHNGFATWNSNLGGAAGWVSGEVGGQVQVEEQVRSGVRFEFDLSDPEQRIAYENLVTNGIPPEDMSYEVVHQASQVDKHRVKAPVNIKLPVPVQGNTVPVSAGQTAINEYRREPLVDYEAVQKVYAPTVDGGQWRRGDIEITFSGYPGESHQHIVTQTQAPDGRIRETNVTLTTKGSDFDQDILEFATGHRLDAKKIQAAHDTGGWLEIDIVSTEPLDFLTANPGGFDNVDRVSSMLTEGTKSGDYLQLFPEFVSNPHFEASPYLVFPDGRREELAVPPLHEIDQDSWLLSPGTAEKALYGPDGFQGYDS